MENQSEQIKDLQRRMLTLEAKVDLLLEQLLAKQNGPVISPERQRKAATQVQSAPTVPVQPRETSGGSAKFLGAVGVLCFVLAASYFIKLAIDEGWLTPTRQLIGAWLFGFSLIAVGFRLREEDNQYASFLPGAGIVVLFMASYAGHLYYQLYGLLWAACLVNAISIGSIALYKSFRQSFYALAAIVGTYLVPLLLNGAQSDLNSLSVYFLFWGVLYAIISVSLRSRIFIGLAAYLAICSFAVFAHDTRIVMTDNQVLYLVAFQTLQFLLFSFAVFFFSVRHKEPLTQVEAWAFFPVLLLFYATQYSLIYHLNQSVAPWCALGFAAIVYATYLAATKLLRTTSLQSFPMIAAFLAMTAVHALYLNILPDGTSAWFSVLLLLGFLFCQRLGMSAQRHWVALLILGWIVLIEFGRALLYFDGQLSWQTVAMNISYALLLGFAAKGKNRELLLRLAGLQLLFGLKHMSELTFAAETASYATSALWGIFALSLLGIARQKNSQEFASAAVLIFGVVAMKVMFSDLSASGPTAQIVALIVIGVLFYSGGYIYRQIGASSVNDVTDDA